MPKFPSSANRSIGFLSIEFEYLRQTFHEQRPLSKQRAVVVFFKESNQSVIWYHRVTRLKSFDSEFRV